MFSIVTQNHEKNIHTVVCGLIRPQWLKKSHKGSAEIEIFYVLLTVSKEQRRTRLLET